MVGFEPPVQQFAHGEHRCRAGDRASGPVLVGELRGVLLGMGAAAADLQGSVLGGPVTRSVPMAMRISQTPGRRSRTDPEPRVVIRPGYGRARRR